MKELGETAAFVLAFLLAVALIEPNALGHWWQQIEAGFLEKKP